jgi:hypothetical protein
MPENKHTDILCFKQEKQCIAMVDLLYLFHSFNKYLIALDNIIIKCQRLIIVPPELAYGKKGIQEIPPNATIEVNCHLFPSHLQTLSCSLSVVSPGSVLPSLHLFFFMLSLFNSWMLSYYPSSRVRSGKGDRPVLTGIHLFFSNCHYNVSLLLYRTPVKIVEG